MKKIKMCLITLHDSWSYGAQLQAYATQYIFEKNDFCVEIVDYVRKDCLEENFIDTWSKGNRLKKLILMLTKNRMKRVFCSFRKDYLNLTKNRYLTEEDFIRNPVVADVYCTGSDQVWNSKWNKEIIPYYYLSFADEGKSKYGFSSSFGHEDLSQSDIDKTYQLINSYSYITVREAAALNILKSKYDYTKCAQQLDPTLLLDEKTWLDLSKNDERKLKGQYLLYFCLNRNHSFNEYAKKLSKKLNLKLVKLSMRFDQISFGCKNIVCPDVLAFVNYFANADFVLTDSFHGVAFSLNLRKNFACLYPKEFSGRLESVLEMFDVQNRAIRDFNDFSYIKDRITWDKVAGILESERDKAEKYILKIRDEFEEQREGD